MIFLTLEHLFIWNICNLKKLGLGKGGSLENAIVVKMTKF